MIDIAAGKSTPRVLLDSKNKDFIIEGQSYPENSGTFYEPVISWLRDYLSKESEELLLKIKLIYINTSSTKAIITIFDILDEAFKKGKNVKIDWCFDSENEMARETGQELLEDLSLPFNMKEE